MMGKLMCSKFNIYFLVFSVLFIFSSNSINVFKYIFPSRNSNECMFIQLRSSNEEKIKKLSEHNLESLLKVSDSEPESDYGNVRASLYNTQEDHKPPKPPKRTVSLLPRGNSCQKDRPKEPEHGPPPLPPRDPSIFEKSSENLKIREQLDALDGILNTIEKYFSPGDNRLGHDELPEDDDVFD